MADLFRAAFYPKDLVWIDATDGHFYKGQVVRVAEVYKYRPGIKRGGSYKVGNPHKIYHVFCMDGVGVQRNKKSPYTIHCTHNQLYPRTEVSSPPPDRQVREDMIKEILSEKLL